jgi:hypothetical protein
MSQLTENDRAILTQAVGQLEHAGLAAKLAAVVGMPVEKLLGWLPDAIQTQVNTLTEEALEKALRVAMKTLDSDRASAPAPWNLTHKAAVTLSGVTGGMFGAPALVVELPITTVIILRSIADIARSKGEKLSDPAVQLACLEVFALGSGEKNQPKQELLIGSEEAKPTNTFGPPISSHGRPWRSRSRRPRRS